MSREETDVEYSIPLVVGSLILGVFFGGVGGGVAFPTLPLLGAILGISPFVVGVILSANRFTRLVLNAPAGQVIDRFGTKWPMVGGLFLQALAPFGYVLGLHAEYVPLLGAAGVFIGARIVWGLGSAFVFVGAFSTVVHVTERTSRGKWIGYFRGGQSLGFPSGLVLGGILTDLYSFEVAFVTAGMTAMFATLLAMVVLPEVSPSVGEPTRLRDMPAVVRADERILAIGTVNFVVRFLFAGVLISTVVLYAEAHHIEIGFLGAVGVSGVIMAVSVLGASGMTMIAGNLSDRVGNRALVSAPAMGILALGFAMLGFFPTLPAILVGVTLIGIGVGGTNPPLLAYLGDISPADDVGKMGGVYNVFGDIGSTLGPLIALPLAAAIGYRTGYGLSSMLAVLTVLVIIHLLIGASTRPLADSEVLPDD